MADANGHGPYLARAVRVHRNTAAAFRRRADDFATEVMELRRQAKQEDDAADYLLRTAPTVKRGRPRVGESAARPWVAAGMTKSTWYRRQAEQKVK